jgi:type I restriction enzyme S subunit
MTTLKPEHKQRLVSILEAHFHDMPLTVYVFGSRASDAARVDSDLDLLLDARDDIPLHTLARLKEAFEESDLPFRVDVVCRAAVSPAFYRRIQADLVPLCTFGVEVEHT